MNQTDPIAMFQSPEFMQRVLTDLQNPAFRDKVARDAAKTGSPPPDIEAMKAQLMGGQAPQPQGMPAQAPQQPQAAATPFAGAAPMPPKGVV